MLDFLKKQGYLIICAGMIVALVIALFWAMSIGTVKLPMASIYNTVMEQLVSGQPIEGADYGPVHDIIWLLRLPRLVLAALVGMGLSVCGVIMQAVVKNPLADPYILGISSGASLGATAAILLGIGVAWGENFVGIAAFIGAFAMSLGVLFISNLGGRSNSVKLLLGGMALSAVCGAFSSFIVYFANNKEGMQTIAYWMMGSFAGAKWETLAVIGPIVLLAVLFFWTQSRMLNLMLLGDESALTLGTDLHIYRQVYLLVSSLIVGFVVYAAGMVGFVGLVVPHVIRMLVGTDHKKLIPVSAMTGAVFLVIADGLCRVIIPRTELPIGILISLIGAPCFVYLMIKKTYGFGGN
ncbi:iron ABC transporter permease [uncultured Phascolarctobacterium sp.]|jgi:iron complex transport system permease protein|uniref:FecCD family ABC transporter permease n=1 Tax=uncultured Phascolarctobacterium sp. TaxID=512296 RepID=UPI0025EE719F|nr:iron ABC transporter permease [uncultured Phascolarctobacterium sp.]